MVRVAVLAALEQELAAIHDEFEATLFPELMPLEAHRFRVGAAEVVVVRTGVGKVNAAMAATRTVDVVRPDAIINTGVAGGLAAGLEIGDVVVAADCAQHDLDASRLGFRVGEVPYTDVRFIAADPEMAAAALAADYRGRRISGGRVLSGDQFIRRPSAAVKRRLDELAGTVVEMEGAAIAYVAHTNDVRFAIVRTVSDLADGSAAVDFERFLPLAAANSVTVCRAILDHLSESDEP